MWPSQRPQVTASAQQAKAKADTEQNQAEKARALAAKRALFDQKFPPQVPVKDGQEKKNKWDDLISKQERD